MDRNSPTRELETAVERFFNSGAYPTVERFIEQFVDFLDDHCRKLHGREISESVGIPLTTAAGELYALAGFTGSLTRQTDLDRVGEGVYRDQLLTILSLAENPEGTRYRFVYKLLNIFDPLMRALPQAAFADTEGGITIPLIELLRDPAGIIARMQQPVFHDDDPALHYLRRTLNENGEAVAEQLGKVVLPDEHPGNATDIVQAYLWDTPLLPIFDARVPFDVPMEDRGEHTAIVGGAGHGKTQLLQTIIAADLELDDPPGMVVIDSTGAMVQRIQRLAVFNGRLRDRLLIIDPELNPVPALNPFDLSSARFASYDGAQRERIQGEIIDLFNYVFSTINNALTTRMATAFAFMVRLILSIDGADIHTLLELLDDDPPKGDYGQAKFKEHIDKLDPTTQHFFQVQYYTGKESGLREQIRARVFDILRVPAFERMFSHVNTVDFFAELNKGAIILVNTSENLLKDGSTTFGRYIIARCMAAAFERASIPQEKRKQAFIVIDEAAQYFDETFEKLLNRARQFKLGGVIAFQNLDQASEKLKAAIASSTAVKYAGGTGYADARWFAREMRVEPEFIISQKRDSRRPPQWTQFACYVRNYTDRAISLTVPFYTLENLPKMSEAEHAALLARNKVRVSAPAGSPLPAKQRTPTSETAAPTLPNPAALKLASAYTELAAAIGRSDWDRAAELQNRIIPALLHEASVAEPRLSAARRDPSGPAAANPDKPRPATAHVADVAGPEGTTDWR